MSKKQLDEELYAAVEAAATLCMANVILGAWEDVGMHPQLTRIEREMVIMVRNAARAYRRAR